MADSAANPILLVDGYNIIWAWPRLQRVQADVGLDAARHQLTEALVNYSAFQGYQTHLVFDAQYHSGQSTQDMVTDALQVCYTEAGQTADSYIELFCAQARGRIGRVIVATNDRAQKHMVIGYGADWMSAHRLTLDLENNVQAVRKSHQQRRRSTGRSLADSLDPEAKRRLEQLRFGDRKT